MKGVNRMLCLVDGEHYLPVTKQAIDTLNNLEHIDIAAAVFIGGTESSETTPKNLTLKNWEFRFNLQKIRTFPMTS